MSSSIWRDGPIVDKKFAAMALVIRSAVVLVVWMVGMGYPSLSTADHGPIQSANRFPLHLMFLTPTPLSAELPPPGFLEATMSFDYSNTFINKSNSTWDLVIDMEMTVLGLELGYGIGSHWALRLDLPLVRMGDGFLDGLLENYHRALGVGNYDRHLRPKNQFAYRVIKSNQVWFEGEPDRIELADPTLSLQYELVRPKLRRDLLSTLMIRLKLPAGDKEIGLGSGNFDLGLFAPSKWRFDPLSLHLMPGYVIVGDPETDGPRIAAKNLYGLFAGVAYDLNESWAWLLQLNAYSTPLEDTGIESLDDGALDLTIGFTYQLAHHWLFELSFSEDLTRTAPDFTVRFAFRRTHPATLRRVVH
jgi:hypothetical protein